MSTDANYIFDYYSNGYISPTPMERDIKYLEEKYGGYFTYMSCSTIFWEKPKYFLDPDEYKNLCADKILEKSDCELFEIVFSNDNGGNL